MWKITLRTLNTLNTRKFWQNLFKFVFQVPGWGRNDRGCCLVEKHEEHWSLILVSLNFSAPLKGGSIKHQQSNEYNFVSKVNLMFSMKRHLVWLENILSPISCLMCVGFLLSRSVALLVFQHQSRAITKLVPLAVRTAQSQLPDLSVFSRIRQKCVSFTWCSSLRLHQPQETWVH